MKNVYLFSFFCIINKNMIIPSDMCEFNPYVYLTNLYLTCSKPFKLLYRSKISMPLGMSSLMILLNDICFVKSLYLTM